MTLRIVFTILAVLSLSAFGNSQTNQFPHELKGYEFFAKGKLKKIVFGKTKKKDIEKAFGTSCESGCDYDRRFTIKFDYLDCDDCMTTEYIRNRAMCPLPEFMGTIEKITLTPRTPMRFDSVPTTLFKKHTGGSVMFKDGSEGVSYESFSDEYGLKYSIKQGTSSLTLSTPAPEMMNGPLYSIEYGINIPLETKIFSAPYKDCMKK